MLTENPRSIGPYELLELLGQGGMGQVWRARHRLSGQTVALKSLKAASEGLLRSLRREIHALARLRHPGVVRILEEGLQEGLPWYAMELLEGRTLRQWRAATAVQPRPPLTNAASAETWWTFSLEAVERRNAARVQEAAAEELGACNGPGPVAPAALRDGLSLMRRLCAPLAYLHGEGLVHCDLKPDNILVTARWESEAGLWPVLVDFGLAGQFATLSREALELETSASGTVAYMAPEQLRGEALDARADLYALGCILYELLTGRPPFFGKTPLEVLEQHLGARPPPPSSLVPELPPELDALVLRLLEKEPRRRFGYADDVAAALAQLGAEDGLAAAGLRPRAYLYRPGFCGREEPLRRLQERLLRLQEQDAGAVVLLGGESGVGKTRLLMEVGKEAVRRRLQVLGGECQGSAARPLGALRKPLLAIADRCRARGEQETVRLLGRRGPVLALYEPTLADLPGQVEAQDVAPLPADAARQRLYSYLTETLAAFAWEAPLVLLLDDLQWADDLAVAWLKSLSRAMKARPMPLLVIGAYRTEELGALAGAIPFGASSGPSQQRSNADAASPPQGLLESSELAAILLERLGEEPVRAIVGDMLALEPAPALFSRYLARHSEGNPFFVAEYLRAAVEEGLLGRDGQGHWQIAAPAGRTAGEADYTALPLPGSIRELVGRRLEGMPPAALRVLEAAAVLGREAELSLVQEVGRLGQEQLDEALSELLRRQVLEAPGPELLRFAHDKIREVAYEGLQGEGRLALHRAAAEALEARPADVRDRSLAALGHHWEQTGEAVAARRCYLAAARQATARYALGEGEKQYRAYLRLVQKPELENIAARNELGEEVLRVQGRMEEELEEHRLALEEARAIGDRGSEGVSLHKMALVQEKTGRTEQAQTTFEQALRIHREVGDRRAEGRAISRLGTLRRHLGHMAETQALYEQALRIHLDVGDRQAEADTLTSLGELHSARGQNQETQAAYEQALAIQRNMGDRPAEARTLSNLGIVQMDMGRLEDSSRLFEQALELSRKIGYREGEGNALSNLASVYHQQGRGEDMRTLSEKALAIHSEIGHRRAEAITLANLADRETTEGRLEVARARLEQALNVARSASLRRFEGIYLGELARLDRLQGGDLERAELLAARAEALVSAAGQKREVAELVCSRGHIALARGRSAREFLELARSMTEGPDRSQSGKAIAGLSRAVEAFEADEHHRLFRGELVEELPEGLRRRFIETGELCGGPTFSDS